MSIGHTELRHCIQDRTGNLDLRDLFSNSSAPKRTAEFILQARHGSLEKASQCVSGFLLPTASTNAIDMPDVRIALVTGDT